jgi:hypothetical protein
MFFTSDFMFASASPNQLSLGWKVDRRGDGAADQPVKTCGILPLVHSASFASPMAKDVGLHTRPPQQGFEQCTSIPIDLSVTMHECLK